MSRFDPSLLDEIRQRIPLHQVVQGHVKLTRAGREWKGLSPFQKERSPSFYVNEQKGFYHCFSSGKHGDHFAFLMEVNGMGFIDAVQYLAGMAGLEVPKFEGRGRREETPEEQNDRKRREEERELWLKQKDEEDARRRERKQATAGFIWKACRPVAGTLAEKYLLGRGLSIPPMGWPECIGFSEPIEYELLSEFDEEGKKVRPGPKFHALVGRVDGMDGSTIAVWRIFLGPDGKKAPVDNPKVGLGPAGGGAVRIGGIGEYVGVGEGLETSLAAWELVRWRYPVWSTLSTSGMQGFDPPLDIERIRIFPDGDKNKERPDGTISEKPGWRAATALDERMKQAGVGSIIQFPPRNSDFLDVLNRTRND